MKKVIIISLSLVLLSCAEKKEKAPDPPKPEQAEVIKKLYNSFAEGDIESVLASFSEDIQWNEAENFIYSDGNPYVGGEAVLEGVFKRLGEEWEYWNLDDINFHNVDTDKVLVTGRYKAMNKATGKELDSQFAHLWTVSDTLATSFQQYTDTKQAAEVVVADEE